MILSAREALARSDPVMRGLIEARPGFDPLAWRRQGHGLELFGALLRQVVGQQISTTAARAIFGRLAGRIGHGPAAPAALLALSEEELRAVGLSRAKVASVRDVAAHVADGRLDFEGLAALPDHEVRARLTAVRGIGPWSADSLLLRELGRPDVLLAGDLGIRKAVQRAYGLPALPTPKEVAALGERWRPHRSLATSYLYASLAGVGAAEPAADGEEV